VSEAVALDVGAEVRIDPRKVGMLAFLTSEAAFFSTLVVGYIVYLGKSIVGPTPREVLSLPLVVATTVCLLTSSYTVHRAERALRTGTDGFARWWAATAALGAAFLAGTAYEWYELIATHGLTLGTNLFGTTYFTLVGFHAAHVTVGVIVLLSVLGLWRGGHLPGREPVAVTLTAWYWHFVDGVWVVVFTVVYVVGR
jgi:cytochrome c oxidase subunit 3/cytochrome o ubiquinol oxidase subunit 3